jgi:hypothetical protein
MSMHDHDPDLIMALAAGTSDRPTADEVAALEACDRCSADLAAQRATLAFLADAPPVHMTELEAARFRRDLDTALGHERAVAPAAPRRRRINWAPAFSIAAILLALVLVAPALQLLGSGGDDAGTDLVAFDAAAEEEAPSAEDGATQLDSVAAVPEVVEESDAGGDETGDRDFLAGDLGDPYVAGLLADLHADLDGGALEGDDAATSADRAGVEFDLAEPEDRRCVTFGAALLEADPAASTVAGELRTPDGAVLVVTQHLIGLDTVLLAHDEACEVVARTP